MPEMQQPTRNMVGVLKLEAVPAAWMSWWSLLEPPSLLLPFLTSNSQEPLTAPSTSETTIRRREEAPETKIVRGVCVCVSVCVRGRGRPGGGVRVQGKMADGLAEKGREARWREKN